MRKGINLPLYRAPFRRVSIFPEAGVKIRKS
jgi:hypothetical protein